MIRGIAATVKSLLAIAPLVVYNVPVNVSEAPVSGVELNDKVARSSL